ncbi:histone-like nucleoid-structuring protein Lsr2 [Actinoplanes sp. URMC 104]|uniref:histone-like nucleoid-structuring protein Lsr2 n=1 Tax=Actinoplanes sp. URMC 104 TaxID=3423409 RepID=UPI003F199F1F
MVIRVQRFVVDDLDQSIESVGTYRFALEGTEYEIDLADHNLERLRLALRPFIAAGRRLPKAPNGKTRRNTVGAQARVIRQWWHDHRADLDLPPYKARGAVPSQVKVAFRAASQHGGVTADVLSL